jgi:hypothetical protein
MLRGGPFAMTRVILSSPAFSKRRYSAQGGYLPAKGTAGSSRSQSTSDWRHELSPDEPLFSAVCAHKAAVTKDASIRAMLAGLADHWTFLADQIGRFEARKSSALI